MTDETRARFLAAIAKQIPAERVIEVHLFSAIRQGGAESGVAVIAVERHLEPSPDVDGGYIPPADVAEPARIETQASVVVHDQLADETAFVSDDMVEVADEATDEAADVEAGEADVRSESEEESMDIIEAATEAPEDAPAIIDPADAVAAELTDVMAAELGLSGDASVTEEESAPASLPPSRYIVYSARYRHTLKGIDRGKWEVSVTEQADAPLLTVDAVVRGVQRRSGDADETVRLSGDEFRAALPVPVRLGA